MSKELDLFWEKHSDVKPCPFCGSDNIFIHEKAGRRSPYNSFYYLKCKFCGGSSGASEDIDAVYEKWQTRKCEK